MKVVLTFVTATSIHRNSYGAKVESRFLNDGRLPDPTASCHWLATLSRRQRQVAEILAGGETTQAVAKQFRLSQGRISQLRRELLEAFQGLRIPEAA